MLHTFRRGHGPDPTHSIGHQPRVLEGENIARIGPRVAVGAVDVAAFAVLAVDELDAVLLISVLGVHEQRVIAVAPIDGPHRRQLRRETNVDLARVLVLDDADRQNVAKLAEQLVLCQQRLVRHVLLDAHNVAARSIDDLHRGQLAEREGTAQVMSEGRDGVRWRGRMIPHEGT